MGAFSERSVKMLRVVVCVSGGGTNLQAIIDGIAQGAVCQTEIVRVITIPAPTRWSGRNRRGSRAYACRQKTTKTGLCLKRRFFSA